MTRDIIEQKAIGQFFLLIFIFNIAYTYLCIGTFMPLKPYPISLSVRFILIIN